MTVGEIVAAVDIGQSTVSHHLKLLMEACFVHLERRGTASFYRANPGCMDELPAAAEAVMARRTKGTGKERKP